MKNLKSLILPFLAFLVFQGCMGIDMLADTFSSSWLEAPDGFVKSVFFSGDIIDVEQKQITSKEELIMYINTIDERDFEGYGLTVFANYDVGVYGMFASALRGSNFRLLVYVNILQNNQFVMSKTKYKNGMPIILIPSGKQCYFVCVTEFIIFRRIQPVILVKGDPEYWADSSFEYNDRTFTILSVGDGDENAELRFTYTITLTTVEELARGGYL